MIRWDIECVNPPWGDRPSIYQHILAYIRPGEPGLGEKGDLLPDEEIVRGGKEIGWAPGALDGVFGHHVGSGEAAEVANKVLESFSALSKKAFRAGTAEILGEFKNQRMAAPLSRVEESGMDRARSNCAKRNLKASGRDGAKWLPISQHRRRSQSLLLRI